VSALVNKYHRFINYDQQQMGYCPAFYRLIFALRPTGFFKTTRCDNQHLSDSSSCKSGFFRRLSMRAIAGSIALATLSCALSANASILIYDGTYANGWAKGQWDMTTNDEMY